ncbi:hypothetical protein AVEN_170113-1 [Araneus ventricosus]|uniref:Uncharacterized protein n=1 Tax=Araneus ventricosus TaxID=182803 RepID=A0A4Y2T1J8_ARAVE|nr:hypothetical protein AVEN_170113-1 [Araneus ventricosus]
MRTTSEAAPHFPNLRDTSSGDDGLPLRNETITRFTYTAFLLWNRVSYLEASELQAKILTLLHRGHVEKRGITGDAASRREAIRKRVRRVVETEEERSRRLSTMAQRGQDRRAKETEEPSNSRLSDMAQRGKRGITGDAASRRESIRKRERELLKLKKKETADCQLWHNVARTEERKKQKNKEIADCQTWHNVGRRRAVETEEQK